MQTKMTGCVGIAVGKALLKVSSKYSAWLFWPRSWEALVGIGHGVRPARGRKAADLLQPDEPKHDAIEAAPRYLPRQMSTISDSLRQLVT